MRTHKVSNRKDWGMPKPKSKYFELLEKECNDDKERLTKDKQLTERPVEELIDWKTRRCEVCGTTKTQIYNNHEKWRYDSDSGKLLCENCGSRIGMSKYRRENPELVYQLRLRWRRTPKAKEYFDKLNKHKI